MNISTISILIALVGCFVGLAGWISGRDKKIANDSEWKGTVNAKLDNILSLTKGLSKDIETIKKTVDNHSIDISVLKREMKSCSERFVN